MANQLPSELATDPANANLANGDIIIIQRNDVVYKAVFGGKLLLPAHSVADAGKYFGVNSQGNSAVLDPPGVEWSLLFTSPQSDTGISLPQALPANTLDGIRSVQIHIDIKFSGQANFEELGFPIRNSTTSTRTSVDGLSFRFVSSASLDSTLPTGAVLKQFWLYGQK